MDAGGGGCTRGGGGGGGVKGGGGYAESLDGGSVSVWVGGAASVAYHAGCMCGCVCGCKKS